MNVHFKYLSGYSEIETYEAIFEGEKGIHPMISTSQKMKYQKGYIPYERFDYAEPEESAEQEAE